MTDDRARFQVEERAAQPYAYVSDQNVSMGNFAVIADRFGEAHGLLLMRTLTAPPPRTAALALCADQVGDLTGAAPPERGTMQ